MQRDSNRLSILGIWGLILLSMSLWVITGCNEAQADRPITNDNDDYPRIDSVESLNLARTAICVWPYAGLRREPGNNDYTSDKENNYITPILYGEKVEVIPDVEPVEKRNRTYMKVKLLDGTEGWVHDFLFERYGRLGVVTKRTEIYRRPDPMTLRDTRLEAGQIIVVIDDPNIPNRNNSWYHVSANQKSPKGWIHQGSHITMHVRDVRAALLLNRAKGIRDKEKRLERLNEILATDGINESPISTFVLDAINELDATDDTETPAPVNTGERIYITKENATVYSEPSPTSANVLKELSEDDVVVLLDVGERGYVGDYNDYWYRIRHENTEGWIFGYFTSKRSLESP